MSSSTVNVWRSLGLTIESEVDLPGLQLVSDSSLPVDLRVVASAPANMASLASSAGTESAGTETIVAVDDTDGRQFELVAIDGWHVLRFIGGEMWFDPGLKTLYVVDQQGAGGLGWLVGGLGLAAVLMLRGEFVLHATAVEVDGSGQLLVAPSGYGKSTTAALACAAGASLIAEDTVRLHAENGRWLISPGSQVVRTRRSREEMDALFDPARVSPSSDGRMLVDLSDPSLPVPGAVALDTIRFVALDPSIDEAVATVLPPMTAMTALLGQVRVPGVVAPNLLGDHFDCVASIVDSVETTSARVPWGGGLDGASAHVMSILRS